MKGEGNNFIAARQAALRATARPAQIREKARLDFARFYFSRGLGAETCIFTSSQRQTLGQWAGPNFLPTRCGKALAIMLMMLKRI